ncbi:hypothetical protein ABH935_002691 [Catenulispora sp. GAS73]
MRGVRRRGTGVVASLVLLGALVAAQQWSRQ